MAVRCGGQPPMWLRDGGSLLSEPVISPHCMEIRRYALFGAIASVQYDRWKGFAHACMAGYDLDGWTTLDLINPDDVAVFRQAPLRAPDHPPASLAQDNGEVLGSLVVPLSLAWPCADRTAIG
jgi:hypothetical protein